MSRMKLVPVSDLFEVNYGTSLELNALEEDPDGVPFVSRTAQNNGVSARVKRIDVPPILGGVLSVALSGSPMATFFQEESFYSGYHVAYLTPRKPMPRNLMLYYAACLRANRYRFSYGRQANRSLAKLLVPDLAEVPAWVTQRRPGRLDTLAATGLAATRTEPIDTRAWKLFKYTDLFDIVRGKGPSLADAKDNPGPVPYVTASDKNNGISAWTSSAAQHPGGCLSVAIDGSVGEVFYQQQPFCANTAVVALVPRVCLSPESLLFIATLIRREGKLKYGYGRKWGLQRMKESTVLLPVTPAGAPDFAAMEALVKGLPAWKALESVAA